MRTSSSVFGLVVIATVFSACSEPPQPAIDSAVSAHQAATTAEAAEYAPEAYRAAADAQAALDAELKTQADKFAVMRSYDRTTELATAAKTASEQAAAAAADGRDAARADAVQRITDARAALTVAQEAFGSAPRGKGTQQDLMALEADLQAAATLATDAETDLAAGRFRDARTKAEASMTGAQAVSAAIEQAAAARRPRR